MSSPLSADEILFRQRLLKACGYYADRLDSRWGPNTQAADDQFQAEYERLKRKYGALDARSEQNILSLHVKAQELARKFIANFNGFRYAIRVISGTRTYEEQDKLYKQGRWGNPGDIITNAKGGQSNHNFGIAWDIGLFDNGRYLTGANSAEEKAYADASIQGLTGELSGLVEWGGAWTSFQDKPHYQAKSLVGTVAEVRELFEAGQPYL